MMDSIISDDIKQLIDDTAQAISMGKKTIVEVSELLITVSGTGKLNFLAILDGLKNSLIDIGEDIVLVEKISVDILKAVNDFLPSAKTPSRHYWESDTIWQQDIMNPENFHFLFSPLGQARLSLAGWYEDEQTDDLWKKQFPFHLVHILLPNSLDAISVSNIVKTIQSLSTAESVKTWQMIEWLHK